MELISIQILNHVFSTLPFQRYAGRERCTLTHFSAGTVSRGKNFDEESNASMSTARDETRDGFYMEDGDPSVAQLLHERTFAFSFWPKVGGVLLLLFW